MRLTVYSDYALRALMYLAVRDDPKPTIGEIADRYGISRNHLMKVVYELGVAGYIETVRGKKGGLRLKRRAEDIGLGEVIRHTEPDLDFVPCLARKSEDCCAITPVCRLKVALHSARRAFLEVLDGYTLADLAANGAELRALLAPTQAARILN